MLKATYLQCDSGNGAYLVEETPVPLAQALWPHDVGVHDLSGREGEEDGAAVGLQEGVAPHALEERGGVLGQIGGLEGKRRIGGGGRGTNACEFPAFTVMAR